MCLRAFCIKLAIHKDGLTEKLVHGLRYKFTIQYRAIHPRISINKSILLFQPNARNTVKTYIYHQLPPKCFGVCYTIFWETTALLAQKVYAFAILVHTLCSKT